MIKFIDNSSASLKQILAARDAGINLIRSSHVGNFNTSTLFIASKDLPVCVAANLRGDGGIHYRPAYLKFRGKYKKIAMHPSLHCFHNDSLLEAKLPPVTKKILVNQGQGIRSSAQLHWLVAKRMFKNIMLQADYFLKEPDVAFQILRVLSDNFPELFETYFTESGVSCPLTRVAGDGNYYRDGDREIKLSFSQLLELSYQFLVDVRENIINYRRLGAGVMLNTIGIIVMYTVYANPVFSNRSMILHEDSFSLIHLAGVRMMDYMLNNRAQAKKYQSEINRVYSCLCLKLPFKLIKEVDFYLTPTHGWGAFATVDQLLMGEFEKVIHLLENNKTPETKFEDYPAFYMGDDISQYDLIEDDCQLYFPDCASTLPQSRLVAYAKYIHHSTMKCPYQFPFEDYQIISKYGKYFLNYLKLSAGPKSKSPYRNAKVQQAYDEYRYLTRTIDQFDTVPITHSGAQGVNQSQQHYFSVLHSDRNQLAVFLRSVAKQVNHLVSCSKYNEAFLLMLALKDYGVRLEIFDS